MNTVQGGQIGSMSLQEATSETANQDISDSNTNAFSTQPVQMTFLQVVFHAVWVNLLKVVFLVAFAFCLLLFPKEEMV